MGRRTQPGKPELTEQFNLLLGGSELCKAYSELNDPIDQLNRFKEQQAMRERGVLVSITGVHGCVLRITPPLVITAAQVDLALKTLDAAFAACAGA